MAPYGSHQPRAGLGVSPRPFWGPRGGGLGSLSPLRTLSPFPCEAFSASAPHWPTRASITSPWLPIGRRASFLPALPRGKVGGTLSARLALPLVDPRVNHLALPSHWRPRLIPPRLPPRGEVGGTLSARLALPLAEPRRPRAPIGPAAAAARSDWPPPFPSAAAARWRRWRRPWRCWGR